MRVAVIGAAGSAGKRHCAAFQAEGCKVVPIEKGERPPDVDIISIGQSGAHILREAAGP